jgi:HAD superfamily hydrolase (TIGR01662 family)
MTMKKPEAILFDMGGVLLPASERYDEAGFRLSYPDGLPEPVPMDWFLGMSQDCLNRFLALTPPRPVMDVRPIIAEWLQNRGIEPEAEAVERWRALMERWEARPVYGHVRAALDALSRMGYRMAVVSNTMMAGRFLREHFENAGIGEFFEVTLFSAEFGVNKPDPAIFLAALQQMGVQPEQAWYVGDKPQRDVCGSHRAGMTAVLVDSAHGHRVADAPENEPDFRIGDISGLPGLLEKTG